jgi:hypothetical protein
MNTQGARTERDAEAAPLLVRIAGLPAEIMESFHSELCTMQIDPLRALRVDLQAARAALAETIHPVVSQANPTLRRVLLDVKRRCFNSRRLARYRDTPSWQALCALVGPSANRVLDLEDAWEGAYSAFLDAYQAVAARERTALTAIATDQRLLRGIALSSTVLIENLPRLGRGQNPRKETQLAASLLRYVSRTAFKTVLHADRHGPWAHRARV